MALWATDLEDTIQGVRAFDSTSGSWLTPDAYAGDVYDPASQKSYLWNGNNPLNNVDPSGYVLNLPQPPEWGPPFWPPSSPDSCDPAADVSCLGGAPKGGLKTIAAVTAHHSCNPNTAPWSPPPGYSWGSEYNTGAANGWNWMAAWNTIGPGNGPFNYQAQFGQAYRPASNFGLGVYGVGAGVPEPLVLAAIIAVGAHDKLNGSQILEDMGWGDEGYQYAGAYCH